jgi:hypothetical protein
MPERSILLGGLRHDAAQDVGDATHIAFQEQAAMEAFGILVIEA